MVFTIPSHDKLKKRVYDMNHRARVNNHEERVNVQDLSKLLARSKGHCEWCNKELDDYFAFDHILPYRVFASSNEYKNLAVSCRSCNARKADLHPTAWAMVLYVKGIRSSLIMNVIDEFGLEPLEQLCMFKSDSYIEELVLRRVA